METDETTNEISFGFGKMVKCISMSTMISKFGKKVTF